MFYRSKISISHLLQSLSVCIQELFVQDLARMSLVKSANKNVVDYNDLANIVDQQETLQFLQGSLHFTVTK